MQRTSCRLLFEEGAPFLFFCCFFLVNLLQAASPPSSVRHFFQFLFFFVVPSHGVHCRPPSTPKHDCVSPRESLCAVCATSPAVAGVNSLDVLHVKGSLGVALVELRPLGIDCSVLEKTVVQGYSQSASRRVQRRTAAQ